MKIKRSLSDVLESLMKNKGERKTKEDSAKEMFWCPYCFKNLSADQVLFREKCEGVIDDEANTADPVFINFWNSKGWEGRFDNILEFPWGYAEKGSGTSVKGISVERVKSRILSRDQIEDYVLSKEGFPVAAKDKFGKISEIRVCPECHCILPPGFGVRKAYYFAVVGVRGSGKTVFMSRFFDKADELLMRTGVTLGGSVDSRNNFLEDRKVEGGKKLPKKTEESAFLPPVFMTLKKNKKLYDCVFYDIAGEDCSDSGRIKNIGEHVKYADGVIMLISPEQLPGVESVEGKPVGEGTDLKTVLTAMSGAGFFGENGSTVEESGAKLAVVISKSDTLPTVVFKDADRPGIEEGNIILQDIDYNSGKKGFMEKQAKDVNGILEKMLGESLYTDLKDYYREENIQYFAVSALGGSAVEKKSEKAWYAPKEVKSMRLEEPLAWMLSELGVIKSVGGEKWTYNGEVVGTYIADGEKI